MIQSITSQAEELEKLQREKESLQHSLNVAKSTIAQLRKERASLDAYGVATTSAERVGFEELRQLQEKTEKKLSASQTRNFLLLQENKHLQESHTEMQRAIREQSKRHRLELAHLNPRVGKLESGLDTTKTAFGDLTLDVELLSNMYRASLFELETNTKRMEALAAERDDVCHKLGSEVGKVVSLRRELERKDAIIMQVMAAREFFFLARTSHNTIPLD